MTTAMARVRPLAARALRSIRSLPARRLLARDLGRGVPLVVVDVETLGLWDHCAPLVERLASDRGCAVAVVLATRERGQRRLAMTAAPASREIAWFLRADFTATGVVPAVTVSFHPEDGSALARSLAGLSTVRVVMQHGLSDKAAFGEIAKPNPLADFDVVFLAGSAFRDGSLRLYRARHPETVARLRFMEIGSPKTDALFDGRWRREEVLRGLRLDPALPTICYAPTWERWASLETHGVEIMSALARLDANVIVKLHHASLDRSNPEWALLHGHGGKDWRALVAGAERSARRLRLAPSGDATPYMVASDLMVSDASGAAYEFVLLDRPVIFFDSPGLFEHYGKDGIHYWGRACGDVVADIAGLQRAVVLNLADPRRKAAERAEWIPRIAFARGDATARAARAILDLANRHRGDLDAGSGERS